MEEKEEVNLPNKRVFRKGLTVEVIFDLDLIG